MCNLFLVPLSSGITKVYCVTVGVSNSGFLVHFSSWNKNVGWNIFSVKLTQHQRHTVENAVFMWPVSKWPLHLILNERFFCSYQPFKTLIVVFSSMGGISTDSFWQYLNQIMMTVNIGVCMYVTEGRTSCGFLVLHKLLP